MLPLILSKIGEIVNNHLFLNQKTWRYWGKIIQNISSHINVILLKDTTTRVTKNCPRIIVFYLLDCLGYWKQMQPAKLIEYIRQL